MSCPNNTKCQLIHNEEFVESESKRLNYMHSYCMNNEEKWQNCKRFMTNNVLHFCPDFVFPDTPLDVDEIIDRYELEYL